MNLHEYQSKALFAEYGIPVPDGKPATTTAQARTIAQELGGSVWVVKAQAHTGARGKAGGVILARSLDEVVDAADKILGMTLVTKQTGPEGLPVHSVLVEQGGDIARELYLGALLDRANSRIVFMASTEGGMDIEAVAEETPEKILTTLIDPAAGLQPYQCRELAFGLGLEGTQIKAFSKIMAGLCKLYHDKDFALVEINPLIVTGSGDLVALDAKVNIDSNALYRLPELVAMRDFTQEDEREAAASEHELNYITLDGNIGCMVNGAGLAMATMDLVKLKGGEPANFLDVGGGATAARVTEAFKLILSSDDVKTILVNIFGGIVRCDLIAEGIIEAAKNVNVTIPVIVRLEGTNAELGRKMLEESGMEFLTAATGFTDAAEKAVAAAAA